MKGKKPHYRPKVIKRFNHAGEFVDYGVLELGILSGVRCVASKETLLLIGAGLTKQKVPDYFHTKEYVTVGIKGTSLKVYAVKGQDVRSLSTRISQRTNVSTTSVVNDWSGGISRHIDKASNHIDAVLRSGRFFPERPKPGMVSRMLTLIKNWLTKPPAFDKE